MYKNTVTVFNRYFSEIEGSLYWLPTIVENCDLIVDQAKIISEYGTASSDTAKLHIRLFDGKIGEKPYLKPIEWEEQTFLEMKKSVTLHGGGDEFDFFAEGAWEIADPILDENYKKGFYDYMRTHFDNVFAVTKVGEYSLIPHLEVVGA